MLLCYEYMFYINEYIFCYIIYIKWLKKEKKLIYINILFLIMCLYFKKIYVWKKKLNLNKKYKCILMLFK